MVDKVNPEAEVEKPEPTEEELAAAKALREGVPAKQKKSDEKAHQSKLMIMRDLLESQKKVSVRIPKSVGPQTAIINGMRYNIPAGISVEVPEAIAALLADAELI